ncbi:MAG: UDP-N-acetylmuramate:L-alanyl-gamma-D-glutamyl-meso-diaminopimelate ligase, partial [Myxococcales bacterium]|nr:UDP-N-acetylmuramate:L-alanyl-gamma-D-glutamyl-meso-diaminopimelate ligase [Myxococcales bacterium]
MPDRVERIHLIGIAGAGMGSFACMLQEAGYTVRGSDRGVYPPMSDVLRAREIEWMEGFDASHLDWGPDLVVVGNVCRRDNPESVAAEARGIAAVSMPQALSDL